MIRVSNPVLHRPWPFISERDPAVDKEHAEYDRKRYMETRDERHLPLKEGCVPSRFVVNPPSVRHRARLFAYSDNAALMCLTACKLLLSDVRDFYVADENGTQRPFALKLSGGEVSEDSLADLDVLAMEIGDAALGMGALGDSFR